MWRESGNTFRPNSTGWISMRPKHVTWLYRWRWYLPVLLLRESIEKVRSP